MQRVILESPYSGDVTRNTEYVRKCMLDAIVNHNESPLVSHLLYTQCLDDLNTEQRTLGMRAGFAWYPVTEKCVVYTDYGISLGMTIGIQEATKHNVPVEYRKIL